MVSCNNATVFMWLPCLMVMYVCQNQRFSSRTLHYDEMVNVIHLPVVLMLKPNGTDDPLTRRCFSNYGSHLSACHLDNNWTAKTIAGVSIISTQLKKVFVCAMCQWLQHSRNHFLQETLVWSLPFSSPYMREQCTSTLHTAQRDAFWPTAYKCSTSNNRKKKIIKVGLEI